MQNNHCAKLKGEKRVASPFSAAQQPCAPTSSLSERPTTVNKRNLKLKASEAAPAIDWAAVNAAPMSGVPDEDSPELTAAQAVQLRPLADVLPAFSTGKTRITINLDDAVLQAYKARAGGRGYQTLINETLRRGLAADAVKEALREVIREELHAA